jgi:hypothetical protein
MGRVRAGRTSTLIAPPSRSGGGPMPEGSGGADVDPDRPWPSDPVEILRILYPMLVATAGRPQPSRPQDARDLVQEAIVEMLVRYPNFEGIDYPLGYARTVVYRLAYAGRRAGNAVWSRSGPDPLRVRSRGLVPKVDDPGFESSRLDQL